jgi:hypothetical protein
MIAGSDRNSFGNIEHAASFGQNHLERTLFMKWMLVFLGVFLGQSAPVQAQNLPPCYTAGVSGLVISPDLRDGDLCSHQGEIKKVSKPAQSNSNAVMNREKPKLTPASKKEIEEHKNEESQDSTYPSCKAITTCPVPSPPPPDKDTVRKNPHTQTTCVSDEGILSQVQSCEGGGPVFVPFGIPPFMDPTVLNCGMGSKPVKRKGITLCGCHELINSKLQTNPALTEGQLCLSQNEFYIASKCEMRKTAVISGSQTQVGPNEHVATPTVSVPEKVCELEKASKEDLKLVRWIQKNQRFPVPKHGSGPVPPIGVPGMGMPGMGMPGMGVPMNVPEPLPPATGGKEGVERFKRIRIPSTPDGKLDSDQAR